MKKLFLAFPIEIELYTIGRRCLTRCVFSFIHIQSCKCNDWHSAGCVLWIAHEMFCWKNRTSMPVYPMLEMFVPCLIVSSFLRHIALLFDLAWMLLVERFTWVRVLTILGHACFTNIINWQANCSSFYNFIFYF